MEFPRFCWEIFKAPARYRSRYSTESHFLPLRGKRELRAVGRHRISRRQSIAANKKPDELQPIRSRLIPRIGIPRRQLHLQLHARADLHQQSWRQYWTRRDVAPSVRFLLLQSDNRAIGLVIPGHYALIVAVGDLGDNRLTHVIRASLRRNAHTIGRRRRDDSERSGCDKQPPTDRI